MSEIVIKAEALGKKYTIGHQAHRESYTALRDVLTTSARGLLRKTRDMLGGRPVIQGDTLEDIWALKDLSFEIPGGEAVGIIGGNGAGKSTLLKILSRITEPSAGRVTIKGRVASLLEVGTGFHPELTGRENVYLNGSILGMTRAEIRSKFDAIVSFAEVERFLDTPVKRYSSGMYVRLAFAVAAHLEPEILVVDEVLAVGDAAFQKKCLGRMGDMSHREGRTVLFVSHNMGVVRSLCSHGFLLGAGRLVASGPMGQVADQYVESSKPTGDNSSTWTRPPDETLPLQVTTAAFVNDSGTPCSTADVTDQLSLLITHQCSESMVGSVVVVAIFHNGTELIHTFDTDAFPERLDGRKVGRYVDRIRLPSAFFKAGLLTVSLFTGQLRRSTVFQDQPDVLRLKLEDSREDTIFKGYAGDRSGLLRVSPCWLSEGVET